MSEQDATPDDRPSDDGAPEVTAEGDRTRDVRASVARLLREHPRTALVTAGVLAFALLGGGAVAAGAATAPDVPVASSALSGADGDGAAATGSGAGSVPSAMRAAISASPSPASRTTSIPCSPTPGG